MTTQTTEAPTNGQIYKDGQWWMQCGSALFPVNLIGTDGKPVPPPGKEEKANNEQS